MDDTPWDLLLAHLSGTLSREGEAELRDWIAADLARAEFVRSLRELVAATGQLPPRHDADAAWDRLASRMDPAAHRPAEVIPLRPHDTASRAARRRPATAGSGGAHRGRLRPSPAALVRVAAILATVAASATAWEMWRSDSAPGPMHEIVTASGQRTTVTLSDGSRLELGPETRLRAPERFRRGAREVEVEGLAFFDIAEDPKRPFTVRARGAYTRVLGTEFTVRAYPEEEVRVAVTEGRVAFGSAELPLDSASVLTREMVGVLALDGSRHVEEDADLDAYVGWMRGRLAFRNEPLPDVVRELGRWYDVEVQLADPALASRHLSIAFQRESLEQVLQLIALALDVDYERDGDVVTLSRRNPGGDRANR